MYKNQLYKIIVLYQKSKTTVCLRYTKNLLLRKPNKKNYNYLSYKVKLINDTN